MHVGGLKGRVSETGSCGGSSELAERGLEVRYLRADVWIWGLRLYALGTLTGKGADKIWCVESVVGDTHSFTNSFIQ